MFPVCQYALIFGTIWPGKVVLPISSRTQTRDEVEEIEAVLSSLTFSEAPTLARLLKYLCNNHFSEEKLDLNEYRIGVEALGRPSDFDPAKNSCVRVEMHRLRARLRKYYETEGTGHTVKVILMEGRYGLQFMRRDDGSNAAFSTAEEATGEELGGTASARPLPDQAFAATNSQHQLEEKGIKYFSTRSVAVAAAGTIALFLAVWISSGALSRWKAARAPVALSPSAAAAVAAPIAPTPENGFVFILAGTPNGKYVDRDGKSWGGDRYFTGGTAVELKVPYIQERQTPPFTAMRESGIFATTFPSSRAFMRCGCILSKPSLDRAHSTAGERAAGYSPCLWERSPY